MCIKCKYAKILETNPSMLLPVQSGSSLEKVIPGCDAGGVSVGYLQMEPRIWSEWESVVALMEAHIQKDGDAALGVILFRPPVEAVVREYLEEMKRYQHLLSNQQ